MAISAFELIVLQQAGLG